MTSNVIDQPAKADEDRLNMKAYADALTEFIANAQSPLTIALQGEWGSGKTSLMNALKASLVDKDGASYLGVWINTWQYALMSDAEEAIRNILQSLETFQLKDRIIDVGSFQSFETIGLCLIDQSD